MMTPMSLVAGSVTANAAASLVAGGLAVLESIFGDQLTSSQLIDRLLSTASKDFDLDGDGANENDYQDISGGLTKEQQYGVGLMDLAAASRPILTIPNVGVTEITDEATTKALFTDSPQDASPYS